MPGAGPYDVHRHRRHRHRRDPRRDHLPPRRRHAGRRLQDPRLDRRPAVHRHEEPARRSPRRSTCIATGARFTVVVNHLKSKGSDCNDVGDPDAGDGQGNCNGTRTQAAQGARRLDRHRPDRQRRPDFLIIGDLNSYAKEDPIDAIKAGPDDIAGTADDFTNLIAKFLGPFAYSYVFDGQSGYLDHALASATPRSARSPAPPSGTSTPTSPTSSTTTRRSSRRPRRRSTSRTSTGPRTTTPSWSA